MGSVDMRRTCGSDRRNASHPNCAKNCVDTHRRSPTQLTQKPSISSAGRRPPTPESRSQSRCATGLRHAPLSAETKGSSRGREGGWELSVPVRVPVRAGHLGWSPVRIRAPRKALRSSLTDQIPGNTPAREAVRGGSRRLYPREPADATPEGGSVPNSEPCTKAARTP